MTTSLYCSCVVPNAPSLFDTRLFFLCLSERFFPCIISLFRIIKDAYSYQSQNRTPFSCIALDSYILDFYHIPDPTVVIYIEYKVFSFSLDTSYSTFSVVVFYISLNDTNLTTAAIACSRSEHISTA